MKKIEAIIRKTKFEDVKEALLELEGRFFCPEQRPCRQPTGSSHYDTPSYYDPE